MSSLLLIPSLRSDAFIQFPDLEVHEAIKQIQSFQNAAIEQGANDRAAFPECHISGAPASERRFGEDVQALGPVEADVMDLSDFGSVDGTAVERMARVTEPGLSGRRAVFVELDDQDQVLIVLGTLVSFNPRRYTRAYWDRSLSDVVQQADASFSATSGPVADDLTSQATELRDIAGLLRKRGSGSLFGGTTDPELVALANRLDIVAVKLAGEPPVSTAPAFDVDQVLEKGKVILDDLTQKGEAVVRQARSKIADILSGRKP
jgi:hypothetical protein